MRIVFFSGKGGSGVSTIAAATAVAAALAGRRTLAFGLRPGLGAALALPLTGEATVVADNLRAVEGRPRFEGPDRLRDWLRELLDWRSMDVTLADDIAALPGLVDIGRLLEIEACVDESLDFIVVDGPSFDQFLDLLAALDAAARWLDRLFPVRQPTVFEPFLRALTGAAPTGDDVYEHGRDLLLRLARLRGFLTDPGVGSIRVVLTADRSALAEAQRAVASLSLFAYPTDAAAVSLLLPPQVTDPFFEAARADQQAILRYIEESLAPIPVLTSPLLPSAPRGSEALAGLASAMYGQQGPSAVLHQAPMHAFSQRDGQHVLSLALPFARREELRLEQIGDNLIVQLGERRRTIALPQEVRYLEALSSSFDGKTLNVTFGHSSAGENAR